MKHILVCTCHPTEIKEGGMVIICYTCGGCKPAQSINKLRIIDKMLKPLRERGRFKSVEDVDKYFQKALELTYHKAIEEALEIIEKTIGKDNDTYQEIKNLLNNKQDETQKSMGNKKTTKNKLWKVRVFDTFSRDSYEEEFKNYVEAKNYAISHSGTMLQSVVYDGDGNVIEQYGTY